MSKELYKDYATQVPSCVSSLTTNDKLVYAGFGEGTIKVFDLRQSTSSGGNGALVTRQIHQHDAYVLKVKLHKATNKLITSSSYGDVNVYDLRNMSHSVIKSNSGMASVVEVHPYNPLIAV